MQQNSNKQLSIRIAYFAVCLIYPDVVGRLKQRSSKYVTSSKKQTWKFQEIPYTQPKVTDYNGANISDQFHKSLAQYWN
jgi:hypothetical protein